MGINTDNYNSYYYNNQYADQSIDDELMDVRKQIGSANGEDSLSLFQSLV